MQSFLPRLQSSFSPCIQTLRKSRTDLSGLLSSSHDLSTSFIYLKGGEPLLHPDIETVTDAARSSGISQRSRILTHGLLLPRMQDRLWESINGFTHVLSGTWWGGVIGDA
jgi:molybdenum cofactor biosynthesis enzyme MoaA